MTDVKEHFSNFAAQMLKTAYRDFRNTDLEYQEIECYLSKHSERLDEILSSLNEKDKEFVEKYISKKFYGGTCANENLYIAGYKDCVKLLRELGVVI
ncbi:hypothetical protein R9X47_01395 [Wukongibacter baidiensis]|uniref:hypothetical protein n=1 Tax=Wukongibacter baidiensis TaxID=1723361 RepID=UPI003D7F415C